MPDVPDAVRAKLLADLPRAEGSEAAARLRQLVREVVTLPEFQLA